MDFLTSLPRTSSCHNAIWVIVGRLIKFTNFLRVKTTYSTTKLARLYVEEIFRLYGVLASMVSNRIPILLLDLR